MAIKTLNVWKFVVVAVLVTFAVAYASGNAATHGFDALAAGLYRAGRGLFSPAGELQHHLGGTVMLCLIPALFIAGFGWKRKFYWAAIAGFWLGLNFFHLSIPAGQADNGELALGSSDLALTDWNWLLAHFNALNSAAAVETTLRFLGFAAFAAATVAGILFSREVVKEPAPAGAGPEVERFGLKEKIVKHAAGFTFTTNTFLVIACLIGGGVALWQNGPDWLNAILDLGRPKPEWPSNYAQGAAQAKTEQKPIILSFTGSDWCPACQELDKYVLNTGVFRDYAAKNLVFVEVDLPQHKSLPGTQLQQNMQLVQKYGIQGFPTLVILSSEGKFLGQMVGYSEMGPKGYIAQIEDFAHITAKK